MDLRILISLEAILVILTAVLIWFFLRSIFRRLVAISRDYIKFYYFLSSLTVLGVLVYFAYRLELFDIVVGTLTAIGALGLVMGFGLVPWLSDVYTGISLLLNPYIKIGTEVEISGKRGRIIAITLTTTRIAGENCIVIVPNRKFRDEAVVVYGTKPSAQVEL
ncbi:MAG: mechanosensitive ion channel family protein [Thaumarchaeota archaeon]|nr:mechanosensitive ion channel family protein [Candidatus Calditenuaceae archaeon]MDW8187678.1 mechanosensitive ion channel [Nitrososphaerota archaeon]